MSSLTSCLKAAGDFLPADAKAEIIKRAGELRREGVADADRQAVAEVSAKRKAALDEIETAMKDGVTLYEAPRETPAAEAEAEAAVSRIDQVVQDRPEMLVQLDGMDAPMKVGGFLAAVKAEADELAGDADLMAVAAECALTFGS